MSAGSHSQAALKGGLGCVAVFIVLGVVAVLFGGSVHIDLGGLLMLLVIGGVIGLVVKAIYDKGRREAVDEVADRGIVDDEEDEY